MFRDHLLSIFLYHVRSVVEEANGRPCLGDAVLFELLQVLRIQLGLGEHLVIHGLLNVSGEVMDP